MRNRPYDTRTFVNALGLMVLLVFAMKATGGSAFAVMIPFAFMAMGSRAPEQLVFVLLVSIVTIIGNGYLMPKNMIYGVAQRGLFVGLALLLVTQLGGHRQSSILTPVLGLLPYVLYMAVVSFMGWCPVISYLKLFLFTCIFFAYYAIAVRSAKRELDVRKLRGMLLAVASFFIIGSVIALRFGWAYMSLEELTGAPVDGTNLFKGMTTHANTLGAVLSVFSLILLTDMLFSVQRPEPLYLLNILGAVFLIARSGSRTSMGTFVLGCCFAFYCFRKTRAVKLGWKNRVMSFVLTLVVLCGCMLLVSSAGRDKVVRFAVKYSKETEKASLTTENVLSSRQGKLDEGLANWRKSPAVGNGFQVTEDMEKFSVQSIRDVLSAPVEKSVWVTAVLEEGGVFGFGIFLIFLLTVFPTLIRRKAYIGGTMLFALVCSNFGEFTIFSMSGGGGMQWGMVFIGLIFDVQRQKNERASSALRGSPVMNGRPRPW